jgi:DNA-binding response OmpR family regulator
MSARNKLLLVSDQIRNLVPLEACLNPFGYELVKVPSLESAGNLVEQVQPDLIILDLDVPSVAAIAFIESVRLKASAAEIPIVILSPYSETELRECGWQIAADEFLERPAEGASLNACIGRLLPRSRSNPLQAVAQEERPGKSTDLLESAAADLEAPLNAIRANVKWTCERLGNDQASLSEALQGALEAADRATALLEEFRTLSTLERRIQNSKKGAASLSKMLTTTVAHYQGSMNMRGIVFEGAFENGVIVQADQKLLQAVLDRILDGLIRSSVRASSLAIKLNPGDPVELNFELRALNDKGARGLLPSVVRATRSRAEPLIGRHFCERVIAAMDGELRVQETNHGSSVRVRLPRHMSRGATFLTSMFPARKVQQ